MTGPRKDAPSPEHIAELLDGRLDARRREALLAELAASDDGLEVLGDAAAMLRELEAAGDLPADPTMSTHPTDGDRVVADAAPAAPPVASPRPAEAPVPPPVVGTIRPARRRVAPWIPALAAAAVIGAVGLTLYRRGAPAFDDAAAVVALLPADARPAASPPPWSTTRGADDGVPARARAIRVGVLVAELTLAARAGDSSATLTAARIESLLAPVPGSAFAAERFRTAAARAGAPPDTIAAIVAQGWESAAPALGPDDALLGAWLGAARAAAARRDAAFFDARGSRRTLDALAARPDLDAAIRTAVDRLRAPASDWAARAAAVDAIVASLGS